MNLIGFLKQTDEIAAQYSKDQLALFIQAYIAALGEVQESLGETGAKQRLMTSYKNEYSRRSAFREEMRSYGW